ncbi:class I poly(R)-hydroxyalkanoic acid synthase [Hyphococcus flavus]|uniref:Class I poly(R)-hydroxyalkanoic acid synthase n=1 Tax=Hyphococcus flavus TaxID=1866326 RepID=A0AAE9ZDV1_9PROT|nr:class I poly(R)-hydroxyalkanoic acid synthase [Hyphococcus flavus]WDI31147.1 class I poly(R)-hydroxyalkanoic acid synthase [Hyphococcus flavus]
MTQAKDKPAKPKKPKKTGGKTSEAVNKTTAKPHPSRMASVENPQEPQLPPPPKSLYEDFDALSEYLTDISGRSQEVIREFFDRNADMRRYTGELPSDPLNVGEAFQEMMKGLSMDPGTVMQRQFNLYGDYAKLMATMSQRMAGESVKPAISPTPGDKRFAHPAWNENHMLDFIKQSYLIFARWLETTIDQVDFDDEHEKKKAEFFTRQFIDAFSPSNFAMLNPEVVEATIESKGENLLKGLKNLLEDIDRGHGELAIRQADLDFFKLGENVATTPGKVVFQNEIFQLIQYSPTTDEVAKTPMLIVPPWINKFYILDLQPKNSFISWLVSQGRTVFVMSWVNPSPELKDKTFEDYIKQGLFEALDAVEKATGEKRADTIGYCIGGTMLSTALALMARKGDDRVNSATFFTAQADFKESGDLLLFVDDEQLDAIEKQMDAAGGVLEGRAMATTFNMLRSNDLIWSFVIDNYLKGKDPARFDLLFWNSDATRMPKKVHLFYLREFYQHNRLAKGEMIIDGEALDLGEVDIPIFMQAGETDHIAPHNSVYRTARLFASKGNDKVQYMLAGSGHIAGVVNHPDKHKYHHSTNVELPGSLDEWKAKAEKAPGSWWPYWIDWLNHVSPGKVPARTPGDGKLEPIEDAPGSYVKVKA